MGKSHFLAGDNRFSLALEVVERFDNLWVERGSLQHLIGVVVMHESDAPGVKIFVRRLMVWICSGERSMNQNANAVTDKTAHRDFVQGRAAQIGQHKVNRSGQVSS